MKTLDAVILAYIEHYAKYADADAIKAILAQDSILDESQAAALLSVLDAMYQHIGDDEQRGIVVHRQQVHVYDADKVSEIVVALLEEAGFESLTSARGY